MKKYIKIWWIYSSNSAQMALLTRFGASIFIVAKLIRFFLFLFVILLIESKTKVIAGFTLWEIILFFLTFNFVDTLVQFLFRDVYRFRMYIVQGTFDFILLKPISPLLRSLFGGSDILDVPLILLSIIAIGIAFAHIETLTFLNIFLYIVLVLNAILIAFSFNVLVISFGILTTSVDNTIMLYRDLTSMGRMPIDIYTEPLRGIITFIIPVGIMMSFPPKALLGILSSEFIAIAFVISIGFLITSLLFWRYALKHYSSASS